MIIFFIFLFYWLGISIRYAIIPLGIVLFVLLFFLFKRYKKRFAVIGIGVFLIGVTVSFATELLNFKKSYSGFVIDSHPTYFIVKTRLDDRYYVSHKENPYEIGDYLKVEGNTKELDFVTLESQFDFKDYLNKKGVYQELEVTSIEVKFSSPFRINKVRENFLSRFTSDQRSLIQAILFSQRDDSSDIYNIQKLHISRLASASGIFIYAYLHLISSIIICLRKKKGPTIIPLVSLIPYIIFTFPRFCVLRIIALEIFRYINKVFLKGKFKSLEISGIVGLSFLLIDYHLGYSDSFILGFTFPILISFIRGAFLRYKGIKKKALETGFIYLGTIPYEIKFYNGFNPLSIILLTVLSPLFIFTAIICLLGFYGIPIYSFITLVINFLSNLLDVLTKLAFQINVPHMSGILIVVYIFLYLIVLYYHTVNFIPLTRLFTSLLFGFLVIYSLPIRNVLVSEVCFINVGQGDACLIRKGSTTILIDTGGLKYNDLAKQTLIPFMQKKRIYDVDLLIITHDDYDHNGASDSLKENFYVKSVVTDASSFPISINGITLNNYNNHQQEMIEENDKSLVVGFTLNHQDFLITGDASKTIENKIMEEYPSLPCDILKVGHHGSDSSTSDEWVKYLSPKEAVISVGKDNRYGHPKSSVIITLEDNGVIIRRTDIEGTITYGGYIFI